MKEGYLNREISIGEEALRSQLEQSGSSIEKLKQRDFDDGFISLKDSEKIEDIMSKIPVNETLEEEIHVNILLADMCDEIISEIESNLSAIEKIDELKINLEKYKSMLNTHGNSSMQPYLQTEIKNTEDTIAELQSHTTSEDYNSLSFFTDQKIKFKKQAELFEKMYRKQLEA